MQDAIILYENGKAIGGEGHPTNASDITFDNSNTDLVSENVEDAIIEVNEKTKHGIVELWKNSNVNSNFAGQNITINDFDKTKYDSVIFALSIESNESRGNEWYEVDTEELSTTAFSVYITRPSIRGDGTIGDRYRTLSITLNGTTLTISVSDGYVGVITSYGTTQTYSINNGVLVPTKILALIHNS